MSIIPIVFVLIILLFGFDSTETVKTRRERNKLTSGGAETFARLRASSRATRSIEAWKNRPLGKSGRITPLRMCRSSALCEIPTSLAMPRMVTVAIYKRQLVNRTGNPRALAQSSNRGETCASQQF